MEYCSTVLPCGKKVITSTFIALWLAILASIQITKKQVDSCEIGHAIPHCELAAEWTNQDDQLSRLKRKVVLKGAKTPYNYFLIVIDTAPPQTSDTSFGKYLAYTVTAVLLVWRNTILCIPAWGHLAAIANKSSLIFTIPIMIALQYAKGGQVHFIMSTYLVEGGGGGDLNGLEAFSLFNIK